LVRKLCAGIVAINAALTLANARRCLRGARKLVFRRPTPRAAIIAIGLITGSVYTGLTVLGDDADLASARAITASSGFDRQSSQSDGSTWSVHKNSAGTLQVEVVLGDMYEVEIPSLAGIDAIPDGWELVVTVSAHDTEFSSGDGPNAVFVSPILDSIAAPRQLSESLRSVDFFVPNCGSLDIPLGIRVRPYGLTWKPGDVIKLTLEPSLRLADCTITE